MNINTFNKRYRTEAIGSDILAGDSGFYARRLPWTLPGNFTQYDKSSMDLAIVIPLFARYNRNKYHLKHHFSVKCSMWSRWALLRNTNIIESGVPILFYVEDVLFETHREYFQANGLRDEDLVIFSVPEDTDDNVELYQHYRCNLGLCQLPVIEKRFQDFARVLIVDADLFFCKTSHALDFHDILSVTAAVPIEKIGVLGLDNRVDGLDIDTGMPTGPIGNWVTSVSKDFDEKTWWDLLKTVYPHYPETHAFNGVSGVWMLYSPKHHGSGTPYGNHVAKTIYTLRNDEATSGTWLRLHPDSFFLYKDVPYYGSDDTPLKTEERQIPYYWFHYRHKRNFEAVWRYHLGDIPV